MEPIPLHLLAGGQVAEVWEVVGEGPLVHRLEEMGLRAGAIIEMVTPGYATEASIVLVGGNRLCLRPDPQTCVLVVVKVPA